MLSFLVGCWLIAQRRLSKKKAHQEKGENREMINQIYAQHLMN